MSLDDYYAAIKPKVNGSWNLHALLPQDLDFFILLSSASGIVGNRGQTNYSIGNTYQDALARHRASLGLKATSLDLGMILSVGFVADNAELIGHLRQAGFAAMRQEEFHAILDSLCDPTLPKPSLLTSQIALGFELPENLKARGIDDPAWMRDPLFRQLYQIRTRDGSASTDANAAPPFAMLLSEVKTLQIAVNVAREAIVWKLCKALNIADTMDVNVKKPLHGLGVDSLVAVELRTWFQRELGAEVAVFDIMGEGSLEDVAALVVRRSALVKVEQADGEE